MLKRMKTKAIAVLSSRVRNCKLHHPHAGTWAGSTLQLGWSVDSPRQGRYVPGTLASMTTLCMVKHVRTMNSRKESTQNTREGQQPFQGDRDAPEAWEDQEKASEEK